MHYKKLASFRCFPGLPSPICRSSFKENSAASYGGRCVVNLAERPLRDYLNAAPRTRSLTVQDGVIHADAIKNLPCQKELRTLTLLRIQFPRGIHLSLVDIFPRVEFLEISRCPQLPRNGLRMITGMPKLRKVVYKTDKLTWPDIQAFNRTKADVSLTLCGPVQDGLSHMLNTLEGLSELKFEDFGTLEVRSQIIPIYHPTIKSISFNGGDRLCRSYSEWNIFREETNLSRVAEKPLLPINVQKLEIKNCRVVDRALLDRLIKERARRLTSLTLHIPVFSDYMELYECTNLEALDIAGYKEFDGEVLLTVGQLKNIHTLHFGGCINLKKKHLKPLQSLSYLRELHVSSSFVTPAASAFLSRLFQVNRMEFRACFGIHLKDFSDMTNLRALRLIDCLCGDLENPDLVSFDFPRNVEILSVERSD